MNRLFATLKSVFVISYYPDAKAFCAKVDEQACQEQGPYAVGVSVPNDQLISRIFGVAIHRRGIQPVHVRVSNRSDAPVRLQLQSIDPHYFSPLEAAAATHHSGVRQFLGFGAVAWFLFFPVLLLLPVRWFTGRIANRRIDQFFRDAAIDLGPIPPGGEHAGFVYTNLSLGTKSIPVQLLTAKGVVDFNFTIDVGGLNVDYLKRLPTTTHLTMDRREVDQDGLHEFLQSAPATTTNRHGKRAGDPVNLVVMADLPVVLASFGARWDLTESITFKTCWKTARAFLIGSEYRYSPVSSLYLFGRPQDIALQRIRNSINERLHLRLWAAPIRFGEDPVWIGQVSRDIGVRFTWKTWNLTTHRIDSDVDEARDYVLEDLLHARHVVTAGYIDGVGACDVNHPRRNLTGDPWYSDGKRAVIRISAAPTQPVSLWLV
jgi:hypothetical protein